MNRYYKTESNMEGLINLDVESKRYTLFGKPYKFREPVIEVSETTQLNKKAEAQLKRQRRRERNESVSRGTVMFDGIAWKLPIVAIPSIADVGQAVMPTSRTRIFDQDK